MNEGRSDRDRERNEAHFDKADHPRDDGVRRDRHSLPPRVARRVGRAGRVREAARERDVVGATRAGMRRRLGTADGDDVLALRDSQYVHVHTTRRIRQRDFLAASRGSSHQWRHRLERAVRMKQGVSILGICRIRLQSTVTRVDAKSSGVGAAWGGGQDRQDHCGQRGDVSEAELLGPLPVSF